MQGDGPFKRVAIFLPGSDYAFSIFTIFLDDFLLFVFCSLGVVAATITVAVAVAVPAAAAVVNMKHCKQH